MTGDQHPEYERGRHEAHKEMWGLLVAYGRLYVLIEDAQRAGRETLPVEKLADILYDPEEGDTND